MGSTSKITWTDATWNIARGCTKVNEDCKFCYMMREGDGLYNYDGRTVKRTKTVFRLPYKLKVPGTKVFMSSLTDVLHPDIDSFRAEAFAIMRDNPHLVYQVLTKRWERIKAHFPVDLLEAPNVWIGVSAGSQARYDEAMEHFRDLPARLKWVSLEPLTNSVANLDLKKNGIGWVVVGGESGNDNGKWGYRPCETSWLLEIIIQCQLAGVPVFMKQTGTHLAKLWQLKDRSGATFDELPSTLQVQQFPGVQLNHFQAHG